MAKLWDKGYEIDSLIEKFTIGNDWELDNDLVTADCVGSMAHAVMLAAIGLISEAEREELLSGLREIIDLKEQGAFSVTSGHEDCHSAIEEFLTGRAPSGKKIHTGRSRNDQVQTALRLWMRDAVLQCAQAASELTAEITAFAERHAAVPMPGRTHMQIAMPSSVGLWAGAFAEELSDETDHLMALMPILNRSPLGSAASYGVPLPLDREQTAELLGFAGVQNNVLYANNSRGKFEAMLLDSLDYITLTLSKAAQDLILFSLPEFGYFSLPDELTTGSSIMPQKKNPDVLELVRSRSARTSGAAVQVKSIIRSLPSGYNRDFQDTKEPCMQGVLSAYHSIRIMQLCFARLTVHADALRSAFTPEIFATDEAIAAVKGGASFRDAYRQVGTSLDAVAQEDPDKAISERRSTGTTGNLGLNRVRTANDKRAEAVAMLSDRIACQLERLTGRTVRFFSP